MVRSCNYERQYVVSTTQCVYSKCKLLTRANKKVGADTEAVTKLSAEAVRIVIIMLAGINSRLDENSLEIESVIRHESHVVSSQATTTTTTEPQLQW